MKVTTTSLTNLQDELTAVSRINNNISAIATAIENTLSRDGTSPNTMGASLDMNSNRIINLPLPVSNTEPVRYGEFVDLETAAAGLEAAQAAAEAAQAAAEAAQAAAETAETNAATSETNAAASETVSTLNATVTAGLKFFFESSTVMAAPAAGYLRFNNATPASVTSIAFNAQSGESGNPDVSIFLAAWDDAGNPTDHGTIILRKFGTPATFAVFTLSGSVTDNGTWLQVGCTYVTGSGSWSAGDSISVQFTSSGTDGVDGVSDGDKGDVIVTGSGAVWTLDWTALTSVIYVAKTGNDANNGTLPHKPKLTIGAAITAAAALGAAKAVVVVLDAGQYTENLTLSSNVSLDAHAATLIGTLIHAEGSYVGLDRHFPASGSVTLVSMAATGTGPSFYVANYVDGRGTGGALTNVNLFENASSGRVLFLGVGQALVPQGGDGVRDDSGAGVGHVHFYFQDLYLAGQNARGIRVTNANSNMVGYIDHILELGSFTGTIGLSTAAAAGLIKLTCSEIIADEVYNIGAGGLVYIQCPKMTGTRTGTPTVEISDHSIHSFANTGLSIYDSDSSHVLTVTTSSNLSAARTLTIVPGDASRTLTISGNATVSQDYSTTGNPQFATIELGNASDTTLSRTAAGVAAIEGNVIRTAGKTKIWIPARAIDPRITNGPSVGVNEMSTNKNNYTSLDFDAATQEFAQFSICFGNSWNRGTVTFQPVWSHASTTTNFGVVWALQGVAISDGDAMDIAFGTEQTSTDTGGTTDTRYIGPESSAITIAGSPAAGDEIIFQIKRNPSDGSDTMAIDARLRGIWLYITTNASTDT